MFPVVSKVEIDLQLGEMQINTPIGAKLLSVVSTPDGKAYLLYLGVPNEHAMMRTIVIAAGSAPIPAKINNLSYVNSLTMINEEERKIAMLHIFEKTSLLV